MRRQVTYKGMWKNIRAFGFANLVVVGVIWSSCRLVHESPKSLVVSGEKGRSIGDIEPMGIAAISIDREETSLMAYLIPARTNRFDPAVSSHMPWA